MLDVVFNEGAKGLLQKRTKKSLGTNLRGF